MQPGTLIVASAYPDPPFDLMENGSATGFDIELMRAICAQLGLTLQPMPYSGDDFNGIFDGLAKRTCDAVISGTTITPQRSAIVKFSEPYLEFNQGIAVNRKVTPNACPLMACAAPLPGFNRGIPLISSPGACWLKASSPISNIIRIMASPPHWMTWRQEPSAWSSSSFR